MASSWHQANAVVESGDVGGGADVEVVGCGAHGVGAAALVELADALQANSFKNVDVEIAGVAETIAPKVAGASQSIKVAQLKRVAKGGCSAIAKKVGAAAVAGGVAGRRAGMRDVELYRQLLGIEAPGGWSRSSCR